MATVLLLVVLVLGVGALASAGLIGLWASPAVLFAAVFGLESFSGNSGLIGFPVPVDRVALVGLLGLLASGVAREVRWDRLRLRPVHGVLLVLSVYGLVSAWWVGALSNPDSFFTLLDKLGLVPFLMFTLAPVVVHSRKQRERFLVVVVITGAYLAFTGIMEGLHLRALVFPRYINDPSVGIHADRARGPFLEAAAFGLALHGCGVLSMVAAFTWRTLRSRLIAASVGAACLLATVFTVTRSVWIGTAMSVIVVALLDPRLRRLLVPGAMATVVVLLIGLAVIPGLSAKVTERSNDTRPVWDRRNTNAAAIRMVKERPIFGFGWDQFPVVGPDYMRQAQDYPVTGAGLNVHNVPLGHTAELGVVGLGLWLAGWWLGPVRAVLRKGPPDRHPWRLGLVAIVICFTTVALLTPLSYALPNLIPWVVAGIVGTGDKPRAAMRRWRAKGSLVGTPSREREAVA